MFKFKLLNPKNTAKKMDSRQSYADLLKNLTEIEDVTRMGGYKEAFSYFEDTINDLYRQENVDYSYVKGVEAVFSFFNSAKAKRELTEKRLQEWDDAE